MKLEVKVVVAAIASVLTPLVASLIPSVDVGSVDAVVFGFVNLVVVFAAGYLAPHTSRPDVDAPR